MNIKPSNIFLDYDLNARLGDAGTMQKLPVAFSDGYLDPYLNDTHFKPINDLFSFGIGIVYFVSYLAQQSHDKVMPSCSSLLAC